MSESSENQFYTILTNLNRGGGATGTQLPSYLKVVTGLNEYAYPNPAQYLPASINATKNSFGIATDISFFSSSFESNLDLVPSNTTPTEHKFAFLIWPSNSSTVIDGPTFAREAIARMLQITSGIYDGVITKCKEIFEKFDESDPELRSELAERLSETLEPFNAVLASIFYGLMEWKDYEPIAVSFLLIEVLPQINSVQVETKLTIIKSALEKTRPSVRFAAIQALDNLGVSEAKRLMASVFPKEGNRLIRNLIEASLSSN